jgi:hypothetical protein
MKVVIAEKPSVAREIALLLGATENKEGYLTGNGYCVTWALERGWQLFSKNTGLCYVAFTLYRA